MVMMEAVMMVVEVVVMRTQERVDFLPHFCHIGSIITDGFYWFSMQCSSAK